MANEERWSSVAYLKLLTAIVFISMAVISLTAVLSYRTAQDNHKSSKTNGRTLKLVEQCVVDGQCGPSTGADPETIKVINYLIDAVGCVLLIEPSNRIPTDITRCKMEAAPK